MSSLDLVFQFIVRYRKSLIQIDLIRELWMIPDRLTAKNQEPTGEFIIECDASLYRGKLFVHNGSFHAIETFERIYLKDSDVKTYRVTASDTKIPHSPNERLPLCTPQDRVQLDESMIENYQSGETITTTIGRYVANAVFLVYPFGDKIPYINEEFKSSKIENIIALMLYSDQIDAISVRDKYVNVMTLFGHSNEIICPNISEKTICIPDSIAKLRQELVEKNIDALRAGDASVMADIEKELIAAYKEHLKGDPSMHFLLKSKYFDVTLKKLLLTQGMVEIFGSPGKFRFVEQPMGRGWKIEDAPTIFNEVRQGSFARAVETADGGVIAKLILRVLQDTRITIADCGAKVGERVFATEDQLKQFEWNYIVEPDGSTYLITKDTMGQYLGKSVMVRTPGYCKSSDGFCAKCFGSVFEKLKTKAFAPLANDFAKVQTTNALKSMHGKSHKSVDVSDINRFILV